MSLLQASDYSVLNVLNVLNLAQKFYVENQRNFQNSQKISEFLEKVRREEYKPNKKSDIYKLVEISVRCQNRIWDIKYAVDQEKTVSILQSTKQFMKYIEKYKRPENIMSNQFTISNFYTQKKFNLPCQNRLKNVLEMIVKSDSHKNLAAVSEIYNLKLLQKMCEAGKNEKHQMAKNFVQTLRSKGKMKANFGMPLFRGNSVNTINQDLFICQFLGPMFGVNFGLDGSDRVSDKKDIITEIF